jgi:hypothetical protein
MRWGPIGEVAVMPRCSTGKVSVKMAVEPTPGLYRLHSDPSSFSEVQPKILAEEPGDVARRS